MSDHVFAVDDEPSLLRLIALSLKTAGFNVAAFQSAADALCEIADPAAPNPVAVILDLNMPEMDGRQFYHAARAAGLTSPVLILSAYGAEQARAQLGAEASMSKPFDSVALATTIERLTRAGEN
jgi:DNA-binding response OmpR family regulator